MGSKNHEYETSGKTYIDVHVFMKYFLMYDESSKA